MGSEGVSIVSTNAVTVSLGGNEGVAKINNGGINNKPNQAPSAEGPSLKDMVSLCGKLSKKWYGLGAVLTVLLLVSLSVFFVVHAIPSAGIYAYDKMFGKNPES